MLSKTATSARPAVRSLFNSCVRRTFSTSEVSGISVSARDDLRPVSKVSVVVKAGSRYNTTPGVAHILEKFAFKNTSKRSALRLVRESELLGGGFTTSISRENIVLTAVFLREDLPYFVEALADTTQNGLFKKYELVEDVAPLAFHEAKVAASNAVYTSEAAAYEVAFRNGLGNPILVDSTYPVTIEDVAAYAKQAYTKSNISIAATNVIESDLKALVAEHFESLSSGSALSSPASKAFSGEARIKSAGESALTLVFPSTSTGSATSPVLANLLGGVSNIKWTPGTSPLGLVAAKTGATIKASYAPYSDASALTVSISGASPEVISESAVLAAKEIKALSNTSSDALAKAIAQTKFAAAEAAEGTLPIPSYATADVSSVTVDSVAKAAEDLVKGPIALGAVGKVYNLPHLDELF